MTAGPLALVTLALMLAERALELRIDARHRAWLRAHGATFVERDGMALIVTGQAILFGGLFVESLFAPWTRVAWWTWPLLALVALAQGLRYWVITTLRERWSTRVATLPGSPPVARGPYRYLRHPNYAAVLLETAALPLAFGAIMTAAAALVIMTTALARRVRIEDRALASSSASSSSSAFAAQQR